MNSNQANSEVVIQLKGMNKWYGEFHVLKDLDLTVTKGENVGTTIAVAYRPPFDGCREAESAVSAAHGDNPFQPSVA